MYQCVFMVFLIPGENKQQEWIQQTFHSLHPKAKYKIANWSRLSGMLLIICVKDSHINDIKNIAVQTVGTGTIGLGKYFEVQSVSYYCTPLISCWKSK